MSRLTAGLDVKRLSGLLAKIKIESELLDDDRHWDNCVLLLSSVKRPDCIATITYENMGIEPRLVGMIFHSSDDLPEDKNDFSSWKKDLFSNWETKFELTGSRKDDPEKMFVWIKQEFLSS